ncbi:MAG: hypothetical protein RSB51_03765 [Clostridia bacterium]
MSFVKELMDSNLKNKDEIFKTYLKQMSLLKETISKKQSLKEKIQKEKESKIYKDRNKFLNKYVSLMNSNISEEEKRKLSKQNINNYISNYTSKINKTKQQSKVEIIDNFLYLKVLTQNANSDLNELELKASNKYEEELIKGCIREYLEVADRLGTLNELTYFVDHILY